MPDDRIPKEFYEKMTKSRDELFRLMLSVWGGETNQPIIATHVKIKEMQLTLGKMITRYATEEKQRQILENLLEVQVATMIVGGRVSGLSTALAVIVGATVEGTKPRANPKEALEAIGDFTQRLFEYIEKTLDQGTEASQNLVAAMGLLTAGK